MTPPRLGVKPANIYVPEKKEIVHKPLPKETKKRSRNNSNSNSNNSNNNTRRYKISKKASNVTPNRQPKIDAVNTVLLNKSQTDLFNYKKNNLPPPPSPQLNLSNKHNNNTNNNIPSSQMDLFPNY
jgi:hypothetical protein